MKLKLLLLLLFMNGVLCAQDTIRTLIITEIRMDIPSQSFVEISNVGEDAIQLSNFELGNLKYWNTPYNPGPGQFFMLPEKLLQPGESFVIATVYDYTEKQYPLDPDRFSRRATKKEMWELADVQIHWPEGGLETDSITPHAFVMNLDGGNSCVYLEQHLANGDSVVVDQVGGVFDGDEGRNQNSAYDVAGVTEATYNTVLVRKSNVKIGNLNFADARGVDIVDSEWIPIPFPYDSHADQFRAVFWTLGNHGDYKIDENTLESDVLEVDWNQKTITVPWGTRNNDDFMKAFVKKPGLAWHYELSPAREDSAFNSARTGDRLTVYACGNDLEVATFNIIVKEATMDQNIVVPKFAVDNLTGYFPSSINSGIGEAFEVTANAAIMDTITNSLFGIGFATQKDTLFKYLEKAPKADWEIVWHDGIERTALQNGDILKITAENGDSKEYYIKVWGYRPSHNAALSAITWPDIPNDLRGLFGWKGDTIPGFSSSVYNYKISIPAESDGIPALVAKTQQLNSKIKVDRATSFSGSVEQRTISFTVTAEDGITQRIYDVVIEKEKSFENTQPYIAEPFLSELVFREQFGNGFIEICNPGNQPLDLSDYMMYFGYDNNPANAAANYSGEANWGIRYRKYIPGYKWVDEMNWAMAPGRVEKDVNVNSIVYPGDVFVMGHITRTNTSGYPWWASEACDIDFGHLPGETYSNASSAASMWYNTNFHIFKILNDSIKLGLKPANDPNDFELIETWGGGDGRPWVVGGYTPGNQITTWIRKPEFHKGVTEYKGSFGTNADDSQWLMVDRAYFTKLGMGYPANILAITSDLGQHFMHEVTSYKSTVTSTVYKVSPGYSMNESIRGMKTGTTVGEFLTNIIKADDNQTLLVKNVNDGSELTGDALLSLNDTLIVLSADSVNTSKYILNVGQGLSSDAVLTSNKYEIIIDVQPVSGDEYIPGIGSISGFEYGTQLKTVLANIQKPRGATLSVIDDEGAYVPIRILNFDTTYVMATVNHNIFIEVVAEDGLTKIVYQLKPDVSQNTAFVLSDVYFVSQKDLLIDLVPRGSSVTSLLKNLIPSLGASIKLVDKLGHERTVGQIVQDDKIVVTSPNGMVTTVYYLSLLHDEYLKSSDYLAYILSNVYVVDQEAYTVNEVSGTETIAEFYSRIRTAKGATAVVVDKDGMGKTSGSISGSDMVKVTSADGKMVVMYKFGPLVSAPTVKANNIQLYPNPTTGKISISGVTLGNRIQVFNLVGSSIRDLRVTSSIESISLDKEPAGIYMIVVTENSRTLGHFKVIKK